MKKIQRYSIGLILVMFGAFFLWVANASAMVVTWQSGTGYWSNGTNWSSGAVPGSGVDIVIDGNPLVAASIQADTSGTFGNLQITSGDTLALRSGFAMGFGGIADNGVFVLGGLLSVNSSTVLSGTGAILLQTGQITGAGTFVVGAGNTIHGAGSIGVSSLVNQGLIVSDSTYSSLTIAPSAPGTLVNSGTIQALAGSMSISNETIDNTGGVIDSRGYLYASSTLSGGTLTTSGSGVISLGPNAGLVNVTNLGQVTLSFGGSTLLSGTIINSGTLNAQSVSTTLALGSGTTVLTGNGSMRFPTSLYGGSPVFQLGAGPLLNLDNTITGGGTLALGGTGVFLENRSLIVSDTSSFAGFTIDSGSSGTPHLLNRGTLRAPSGGSITLNGGVIDNTGGVIDSRGYLYSTATLSGGTLTTSGSGVIALGPNGGLVNVTNLGQVNLSFGGSTLLSGTIINSGTLNAQSVSTTLALGSGTTALTGNGSMRFPTSLYGGSPVFQLGAGPLLNLDNTITGGGTLALGGTGVFLENRSLIVSDTSSFAGFTIDSGSSGTPHLLNRGTLRAASGASMTLNGGVIDNTGGVIDSRSYLYSTAIMSGGTLTTSGSGVIALGPNAGLANVTNLGQVNAPFYGSMVLAGTITNTGSISLSQGSRIVADSGTTTLTGGGSITVGPLIGGSISGSLRNTDNTLSVGAGGVLGIENLENSGKLDLEGGSVTVSGSLVQLAGTTVLNSAVLTSTNPITLLGGALLGPGRIAGSLSNNGLVAPRLASGSNGRLDITGDLLLGSDSVLQLALGGTAPGTGFDLITVAGPSVLNLNGTLSLAMINGFDQSVRPDETFTVITSLHGIQGDFANAQNGTRITTAGGDFSMLINYGSSSPYGTNAIVLSDARPVPEPGPVWLLTAAAVALCATRRSRSAPRTGQSQSATGL